MYEHDPEDRPEEDSYQSGKRSGIKAAVEFLRNKARAIRDNTTHCREIGWTHAAQLCEDASLCAETWAEDLARELGQ